MLIINAYFGLFSSDFEFFHMKKREKRKLFFVKTIHI